MKKTRCVQMKMLAKCVTFDNITQEMKVKKVLPKNKQIWGAPQVMCISARAHFQSSRRIM